MKWMKKKQEDEHLPSPDDQTVVSPIEKIDTLNIEQTPSLLMVSGSHLGRSFPIVNEEFLIGRTTQCDLAIEDDLVSRYHCKIHIQPEGASLIDLGSTNGTLLNGRAVQKTKLQEGDQIQVGSIAILKFHYQEEVEAKFLTQLYEAATRDFLTNTYNKKFFIERLQDEFAFAQRQGKNLSILVIDLDYFKKINDTYGHLAGDLALKKVGHYIMSHTRKDDVVARFGGEEFVVLMRDLQAEQAQKLAENLRQGLSELEIQSDTGHFRVTTSIGVASFSPHQKDNAISRYELLMEKADQNLYQAKNSGRNQVCA